MKKKNKKKIGTYMYIIINLYKNSTPCVARYFHFNIGSWKTGNILYRCNGSNKRYFNELFA